MPESTRCARTTIRRCSRSSRSSRSRTCSTWAAEPSSPELLHGEYPGKHLTGLDLTPKMIEAARAKQLGNVRFVVGDAEALPFEPQSFDAVLCSNSFHHYPHPERFFAEAARVLRPGGRLILRDYTSSDFVVWLMNTFELPLARLAGHGDVRICKVSELRALAESAGFLLLKLEAQKGFRAHLVARKPS